MVAVHGYDQIVIILTFDARIQVHIDARMVSFAAFPPKFCVIIGSPHGTPTIASVPEKDLYITGYLVQ